jgi:hypothetical protein
MIHSIDQFIVHIIELAVGSRQVVGFILPILYLVVHDQRQARSRRE